MQPGSTKQRWRARVGTTLAALLVAIGTQSPAYARKDNRNKNNELRRKLRVYRRRFEAEPVPEPPRRLQQRRSRWGQHRSRRA